MDEDLPRVIVDLEEYKSEYVKCGSLHTLVIANSGKIFAFSCNKDGRCGTDVGWSDNVNTPKMVGCLDFKDLVIEEVDARIHSLALTSTGEIYTWGNT